MSVTVDFIWCCVAPIDRLAANNARANKNGHGGKLHPWPLKAFKLEAYVKLAAGALRVGRDHHTEKFCNETTCGYASFLEL